MEGEFSQEINLHLWFFVPKCKKIKKAIDIIIAVVKKFFSVPFGFEIMDYIYEVDSDLKGIAVKVECNALNEGTYKQEDGLISYEESINTSKIEKTLKDLFRLACDKKASYYLYDYEVDEQKKELY